MVLTNGTTLNDAAVRRDLSLADKVAVKLDAATEDGLKQMNRPVAGVTLESIVEGACIFRQEYKTAKPQGELSLQCMFMPTNRAELDAMIALIKRIEPNEVQLNTPKRPYPLEWHVENRGNHGDKEFPSRTLRVVEPDEAETIESVIQSETGIPVLSIYQKK